MLAQSAVILRSPLLPRMPRRAAIAIAIERQWDGIAAIRNALGDLEFKLGNVARTPGDIFDLFYQLRDEFETWRDAQLGVAPANDEADNE